MAVFPYSKREAGDASQDKDGGEDRQSCQSEAKGVEVVVSIHGVTVPPAPDPVPLEARPLPCVKR